MDNTEKLLRALIDTLGYEIQELDAKPCVKQCEGMPVIFDGGNYRLAKKKPLTITTRAHEIGGTYDFGPSNF